MKSQVSIIGLLGALLLFFGTSCGSPKMFSTNGNSQTQDSLLAIGVPCHVLAVEDKINVSIWNHDDLSIGSVFGIYNSSEGYGKWVMIDEEGFATFPKIGSIQLKGLTIQEAEAVLIAAYSELIIDPILEIKVLNREITILGEVNTPGNFLLDKDRCTLSEMFGKAEGFTDFADIKKIRLVRKGTAFEIDLTKLDAARQHELYVVTGDVIHVPQVHSKGLHKKAPTLIPFASVMTAVAIFFTAFVN